MEVLLHNNTRIPDHTEGIVHHGDDPFPELLRSVKLLENGGATVIVLACITAHYYYPRLVKSLTSAKMFHIVKETADNVSSTHPGLKNVGVLATEGTLKTGIWQDELHRRGIYTVVLLDRFQAEYFNDVVYGRKGLKAGGHNRALKNKLLKASILADLGAEAIIGGCSELPIDFGRGCAHAVHRFHPGDRSKVNGLLLPQFPANEPAHPPIKG